MKPTKRLIAFLATAKLPWVYWDEKLGKLIVIVDNHLMQTYRGCAANFFLANVEGYHKKSDLREGEKQRIWNLEFGILLHKMLELYYQNFRKPNFDLTAWATERAVKEWNEANMNIHTEHKECKQIGGVHGLVGLLIQYATVMSAQNERIRVLGSEISFGRNREVPLYVGPDIEIFLSGRIDLIIDDGYFIAPMDHKSEGTFRDDPTLKYETEEAPTGYIYALSKILPTIVPSNQILKRDSSKILMNLIQKKPTDDPAERFKRVAIRKTAWQLEQYRMRMCSTIVHLIKDMERYILNIPVSRNTMMCSNWYHVDCVFRDVHRQGSKEGELATLNNGYIKLPIWNTENVKPAE